MGIKKIQELITSNIPIYKSKSELPAWKLILLGMLAGAFIAIGASSSSAAVYGIENTGIAKTVAGAVFSVGLILVVMIGAELFTGDCLMLFGVLNKRVSPLKMVRTLAIVYVFNLVGAVAVAFLVNRTGQLDYGSGALGVSVIKTAYAKVNISFLKAFCSGIMCNVLVCFAVLLSGVCNDSIGKIASCFFPIWAFVIGGYEHCVANMYYIPAGIFAKLYGYSEAAVNAGMTPEQLEKLNFGSFVVNNLIPVTLGNIVGGMVFVVLPLYFVHKKDINLSHPA